MSKEPWPAVREYLLGYASYYPHISTWCSKVHNQLPAGRRTVLGILASDGAIAGLAVTKNGRNSKLCHFSVSSQSRAHGMGAWLMRAATMEMIDHGAHRVHVTTSEEVASDHGEFFERCGFEFCSVLAGRYRRGVDELEWVASAEALVSATIRGTEWPDCDRAEQPRALASLMWIPHRLSFQWMPYTRSESIPRREHNTRSTARADQPPRR